MGKNTMARTALLLPVLAAGKSVIPIMDWSLDYGYCKAAAPWLRREQLEPVSAEVGDIIDVRYATTSLMCGRGEARSSRATGVKFNQTVSSSSNGYPENYCGLGDAR